MDRINQFHVIEIILLKSDFSRNEKDDSADQVVEEIPLPAQLNWNCSYSEDDKILTSILIASIGDKDSPFMINVEMEGRFQFSEHPKEKDLPILHNISCPGIIFPYLREYISDLTKRAGLPVLFLPPFNFVAAYKEKKAAGEKE